MDQIRAKYSYIGHFRGTRYGQIETGIVRGRVRVDDIDMTEKMPFCADCEEQEIGICERMSLYAIGGNIYTKANTHNKLYGLPNPPCTRNSCIALRKQEAISKT